MVQAPGRGGSPPVWRAGVKIGLIPAAGMAQAGVAVEELVAGGSGGQRGPARGSGEQWGAVGRWAPHLWSAVGASGRGVAGVAGRQ